MELARLASIKQQTTSPAGPFLRPRATGVPESKKMLPRYTGWFSATFSGASFFPVGPALAGNGDLVVFGPFWAAGKRNSGPWPKTEGRDFPALGVPKSKKKVTTLSGMFVRNFFAFAFCPTGPPRAGNRKIRVFEAILA